MFYAIEGVLLCPICKIPVDHNLECESCGMIRERFEIKHFSFNEPSGMCLECKGRGYTMHLTEDLIVQDPNRNLMQITKAGSAVFADQIRFVEQLPRFYDFDIKTPYKGLSDNVKQIFLYGSGKKLPFEWESKSFTGILEREFEGIIPYVNRALIESKSAYRRQKIHKNFMKINKCEECNGYKLNETSRDVKIAGKHIEELAMMSIDDLKVFLDGLSNKFINTKQGKNVLEKLQQKLQNILDVGLTYLHLNRGMPTLSGGELQRLALMTHLDAGIDSLIYILDEPSMSLHESEKESLINLLLKLKELGNTVIVVEHDKKFIDVADEVIDIGPQAGVNGGRIVFKGTIDEIKKVKESYTGQFLAGEIKLPEKTIQDRRRVDNRTKFLKIKNVSTNNLKNIEVEIPLGMMVGICGVSGSGKSSLVQDTLVPLLKPHFTREANKNKKNTNDVEEEEGEEDLLERSGTLVGWENIDEVIVVNQKPIGRTRRSMPVSYIGIWDKIRNLFAKEPSAKKKKFTAGHFSFNSDKGRCPSCKGDGVEDIKVSFLSAITLPCKECKGLRYKPEILEIKFKGKSIAEVLNITVSEALKLFKSQTNITNILTILEEIGMGYITLGQSAPSLSGGEAQRIKLAKELGRARKSKSLYILDEPTIGLSFHDVVKLIDLLESLVREGNTVVIIEHDPDILAFSDYLIELGPEGGPKGGEIIAKGSPEEIKLLKTSITGPYLT